MTGDAKGKSSITVQAFSKAELDAILESGRLNIREGMDKIADATLAQVVVEAHKRPDGGIAVDQGFLTNAGNWDVEQDGLFQRRIVTHVKHAIYVQEGTKPRTEKNPVPWAPIAAWAERKGLSELTFPIWYSINKKGTAPNPFATRAINWMKGRDLKQYLVGGM